MPRSPIRLVLDTNVIVRGLVNSRSPSGRVLQAVDDRHVLLLLSKPVLAESRQTGADKRDRSEQTNGTGLICRSGLFTAAPARLHPDAIEIV